MTGPVPAFAAPFILALGADRAAGVVAEAATPADLFAAREQMAMTLGWHIVLACLGVGMPALVGFAEWRGIRTGDPDYRALAHQWAKAMGVLFAVGAVSGTILSFEMGLLWPGLMGPFGQVLGLPFAIEGFAFFIEAVFLGIYLYGWDRLPPRQHVLTAIPIVIAGVASAFFVVCANAWMNAPRGFDLVHGTATRVDPLAAMFNPATPPQTVHMILAAFMVAGFLTASVYAVALLRGRRDRYHRLGFTVPFTAAAVVAPFQVGIGDYVARFLAHEQPVKLAAAEGFFHTSSHAPLHLGGVVIDNELRYALEIPDGLSLLVGFHPATVVKGLEIVPPADRPPVTIVHLAFDIMVAAGLALLALGVWFGLYWWRRRAVPRSQVFLGCAALSGVAAVVALETGWTLTEVGRQPWTVYGILRTTDAVNPAPGLRNAFFGAIVVYAVLTVATVYVLRRLARGAPAHIAPQEQAGEYQTGGP